MSTHDPIFAISLAAALGSGLMAGIFFAFSNFVMGALGRIAPSQGIAAMQAINLTVLNPLFLLTFMGTGLLCVATIGFSLMFGEGFDNAYLLAGGVLYLLGTIGVTAVFNVPMNNALARVEAESHSAIPIWQDYQIKWTFWNHVRTVTALCAAATFTLGLWTPS